ncbi:MAG: hypothetical protein JO327_12670 [Nitrososphaeraceae archaeon]|nr:hypothetical protein [Nitrososphaeraceae archaeon]
MLRAISETYYKGSDIGECLSTAYRIKGGDFESWHNKWLNIAQRIHKYAERHKVSAREGYLRASRNFYSWTQKIQESSMGGTQLLGQQSL